MRDIFARHNGVTGALRKRLATIKHDGENRPDWSRAQRDEAVEKAKAVSDQLQLQVKLYAAQKVHETRQASLKASRGGKQAPAERAMWAQLATASFTGKTGKQLLEAYRYMVSKMLPDEREAYRFVLDDALMLQVVGDVEAEFAASQIIRDHQSEPERQALREQHIAERYQDLAGTFLTAMVLDLQDAVAGKEQTMDPIAVFDDGAKKIDAEFTEPVFIDAQALVRPKAESATS